MTYAQSSTSTSPLPPAADDRPAMSDEDLERFLETELRTRMSELQTASNYAGEWEGRRHNAERAVDNCQRALSALREVRDVQTVPAPDYNIRGLR